jgi:hypothetical protein
VILKIYFWSFIFRQVNNFLQQEQHCDAKTMHIKSIMYATAYICMFSPKTGFEPGSSVPAADTMSAKPLIGEWLSTKKCLSTKTWNRPKRGVDQNVESTKVVGPFRFDRESCEQGDRMSL